MRGRSILVMLDARQDDDKEVAAAADYSRRGGSRTEWFIQVDHHGLDLLAVVPEHRQHPGVGSQ
jgi:hypothetical protein